MRALILSGGIYHDFDRLGAALAGILSAQGFRCEIVTHPDALAAALAEPADLVVVQALRWRMLGHEKYEPFRADWAYQAQPALIAALEGHIARGAGLMALHTGCICFDDWPGWQDLLGGGWVWGQSFHAPELEPVTATPVAGHPVTEGLAPFTVTDEHYRALRLDPGVTLLVEGQSAAGDFPLAWSKGRAVTLTTGHDLASLTEPGQAAFIARAARWAAGTTGETTA